MKEIIVFSLIVVLGVLGCQPALPKIAHEADLNVEVKREDIIGTWQLDKEAFLASDFTKGMKHPEHQAQFLDEEKPVFTETTFQWLKLHNNPYYDARWSKAKKEWMEKVNPAPLKEKRTWRISGNVVTIESQFEYKQGSLDFHWYPKGVIDRNIFVYTNDRLYFIRKEKSENGVEFFPFPSALKGAIYKKVLPF